MKVNGTALYSQAIIPAPDIPECDLVIAHEDEVIRSGLEALVADSPLAGDAVSCSHWAQVSTLLSDSTDQTILVISHQMVRNNRRRMAALRESRGKTLLVLKGVDGQEIADAVELDPKGFLIEGSISAAGLLEAVRELRSDRLPVPPDLIRELLSAIQRPSRRGAVGANVLTPREMETLKLLAKGYRNKQIANVLGIGINGAKRHVSNVLAKLNCPNRTLAAAEAVRLQII